MIPVLDIFKPSDRPIYPPNNSPSFEEYFYSMVKHQKLEREYLPVMWTAYYKQAQYGKDEVMLTRLQNFLNSLNRDQPLFTITQYDDGILNDISKFTDLKVFSMVGKGDYTLPLICQPHPYSFTEPRTILANFIGNRTHPIRDYILDNLISDKKYIISAGGYNPMNYCRVIAKSVFALCPRGYSATSFRICEALQYGSIPVIISDEFLRPHGVDVESYAIQIRDEKDINDVLTNTPSKKILELQNNGKDVYERYYTFDSNVKLILENL